MERNLYRKPTHNYKRLTKLVREQKFSKEELLWLLKLHTDMPDELRYEITQRVDKGYDVE